MFYTRTFSSYVTSCLSSWHGSPQGHLHYRSALTLLLLSTFERALSVLPPEHLLTLVPGSRCRPFTTRSRPLDLLRSLLPCTLSHVAPGDPPLCARENILEYKCAQIFPLFETIQRPPLPEEWSMAAQNSLYSNPTRPALLPCETLRDSTNVVFFFLIFKNCGRKKHII